MLKWFRSYLASRSFSVRIGNFLSSLHAPLSCGVLQGSILGPILFSLYLLPLGAIIAKHKVSFHCYANDLQIYLTIKPTDSDALNSLSSCVDDKLWLSQNFLHLNKDKTQYIISGSTDISSVNLSSCGALASFVKPAVRNLGVIVDRSLNLHKQINNIVKTSFFQPALLAKVKPFLSRCDLEKAIHAIIGSRLVREECGVMPEKEKKKYQSPGCLMLKEFIYLIKENRGVVNTT